MVLLWVVQLMFCPQRLLPASVLQLLSVAQSSSRSLTAIAAHPLCRAVSSLEGGRGRPPEQCRGREKKSRGCAKQGFPRRLPQQASAAGVASDDATRVMLPVLAAGDRQPPEIATEGWALRGPTIRTRKMPEQNEMLRNLYHHMPRLNDKQRCVLFDAKFQEREGPYRRGLRMTQEKIKAWCSAYHRKVLKADRAAGATQAQQAEAPSCSSATHEQAPMSSEPSGSSEPSDSAEQPQSQWDMGPVAAPKRRRVRTGPTVKEMRDELCKLGFRAEANNAKGVKAVSAALQLAKQKVGSSASLQPSEVSVGASSPQMVAPAADAMARVESVERVRWHGGARQYLVHLDGKEECEWVDEGTVPEPALEAFERVRMLDASDTEHDDDDSSDDSDCGDDDECVPCCP